MCDIRMQDAILSSAVQTYQGKNWKKIGIFYKTMLYSEDYAVSVSRMLEYLMCKTQRAAQLPHAPGPGRGLTTLGLMQPFLAFLQDV
jgi:hypothetical protein